MKRVFTAAALAQFASADANEWQDRGLGQLAASKNNDLGTTACKGLDVRSWQPTGGSLANATTIQIDDSIDWRDRILCGFYVTAGGAAFLPGGASDYDFRAGVAAPSYFHGYTGIGAYSNLGTGAAVSNGNRPLSGAGAFRSYCVEVNPAFSVWLWVDPTTGSLNLYNQFGATIYPHLLILATGDTGKR